MIKKLDRIFKNAKKIKIDDKTKLVIMSDCHRGNGNNHDKFNKNRNIYETALHYYYKKNFTYIELGDGDEMWEVNNFKEIIDEHLSSFQILKKYHDSNRLIMVYGNHDICKKSKKVLKDNFYKNKLLDDLIVHESIVLKYKENDIFLLHGHQVDLLNSIFWRLSRFLVRHLWRHLRTIGMNDPTVAAKNYNVSKRVEKRLEKWSMKNKKIVISGHTHRPIFPTVGKSLYFNDGSCIHPNGITCLEISNGHITLVKWFFQLENDNIISVGKIKLVEKELINNFFRK